MNKLKKGGFLVTAQAACVAPTVKIVAIPQGERRRKKSKSHAKP